MLLAIPQIFMPYLIDPVILYFIKKIVHVLIQDISYFHTKIYLYPFSRFFVIEF